MPAKFAVLWPVFALAGWTFSMLLLVAARRVIATRVQHVLPREYALGESAKVPPQVLLANRNYMNLLELPVLFYVVCILSFVTNTTSALFVQVAWAYVALRVVHSLVHVSYNHVMHRFAAFVASNFALITLWVLLGTALRGAA
jgi:hypothetical protein